ncbi:TIGR00645 family protein [Gordonia sp. X0973]|uniref:TIGR00645 family protein n=1 Tax=Gordonia sp. X0973 TaxID=2742602 RepID=UPI0013EB5FCA|nr:TIGR00645 family protein [Gordonia sp. X0973]QKT08197.1 TIGR00645 family protein [Gordonia sp. X0973]
MTDIKSSPAPQVSPRHPAQESFVRFVGSSIFISRWLQAPLYIGLIVAQAVYVVVFWKELIHLVTDFSHLSEEKVMLIVLGLVDVVMIANLLIMVIIGGYETFVSRIGMESHPDKPEWLSHVNPNVLKVKLAMSIIGISSIHLLKSFIEAGSTVNEPHGGDKLMWQTIIHMAFIASAIGLAFVDWISAKAAAINHDATGTADQV